MKSVCEGVELSDAVSKVVKACSVRTTNPLLECIKITAENDGMILLATDGELSIRKKIRAEIFEEGSVCVPGKYFAEFIKRLEREQISLSTEGERLDIRYADSVSSLQTLPAEDFPRVDAVAEEQKITVLTKDLKDLIAKTVFCCAQDDSRPVLKGVLMQAEEDMLRFTALDGYRMALCSRPIEEKSGACKLICPGRALTEIARMLGSEEESVEIFAQHNALRVSIDDTELTARLYEGEFVYIQADRQRLYVPCDLSVLSSRQYGDRRAADGVGERRSLRYFAAVRGGDMYDARLRGDLHGCFRVYKKFRSSAAHLSRARGRRVCRDVSVIYRIDRDIRCRSVRSFQCRICAQRVAGMDAALWVAGDRRDADGAGAGIAARRGELLPLRPHALRARLGRPLRRRRAIHIPQGGAEVI